MQPPHGPAVDRQVLVPAGRATLEGLLTVPEAALGVVAFAHGSGSGRHSPRNLHVARALNGLGLATLLLDLLTAAEETHLGALRFDVELLGQRLLGAVDWLVHGEATSHLRLGLFGASTGAAAALRAAAVRDEAIAAVVSRGGRPDLAGSALAHVRVPTLLIVGGSDAQVLELNRAARAQLGGPAELAVIPGAGHLFEEPGTLDAVARLAGAWFVRYLAPGTT